MSSDSSLSDTQTQTPSSWKSGSPEDGEIWGRLLAATLYLPPIDLHKQLFTLGRSLNCDVVLSTNHFTQTLLKTVSKNHFTIERCFESSITDITDLSKNGTFVNGAIVGYNRKVLLQDGDIISILLGTKIKKVYIYKAIGNTEQTLLPPPLKNQYLLMHILGKGTYGEVRLLIERRTGTKSAIKQISKVNFDARETRKLQNEVNILKSLSHPCVVSMKDVVETEKEVFIVLEYMEGGELLSRIKKGMTESMAKFIFYQIIVGVKYLHEHNITHRDIKPGNVLLKTCDDEPLVKIADFGLSKIKDGSELMSTMCGTPYFVAPEVIDSKCAQYSKQVDVWSLGVLLFYMLSNELPFDSKNTKVLFKAILEGKYKMDMDTWIDISDEAIDLIRKMLVLVPTKRITIAEIFQHEWIEEDKDVIDRAKRLIQENSVDRIENDCDQVRFEDLSGVKRRRLV